jgi:peptidyl-prolyl cis-trans isomerase A (cyclophilin A)
MFQSFVALSLSVIIACSSQGQDAPAAAPGATSKQPAAEQSVDKLDAVVKVKTDQPDEAKEADADLKSEESESAPIDPVLLSPKDALSQAPSSFKVRFTTTKGEVLIQVHRDWAPQGADRFYNLIKIGYFSDIAFFRAIKKFMVQFGIHGEPAVSKEWKNARIEDDPVKHSNTRGTITFATSGKNSRTTQVFINFKNNTMLDKMGFAPFGEVVSGMDVVDSLFQGYGEGAPKGRGPNQGLVQGKGNVYLRDKFPKLDYLETAEIVD